ncbi:MAG TPA: alpha/beta fold hydrolase [Spirochaetia bacterium]|nr:alpha/beta fold hydrolase [Spirochaetia bacterium]
MKAGLKPIGPHAGQPVLTRGAPLSSARAAMILVHGRGGSADDMLGLASELPATGFAFLAPEAAGHTWYPNRFLAPIESNEPGLSSALSVLGSIEANVIEAGISPELVFLLGFSQGACLVLEYVARNARRLGGVVGLSGGLIGPDSTPRDYLGTLDGTPVFMGCSDVDPHIPVERFQQSAEVLGRLGAKVTARLYPGMGHTVNDDEIAAVATMIRAAG